jgi:hypothetical protein
MSPAQQLVGLINGFRMSQAIHVVATRAGSASL